MGFSTMANSPIVHRLRGFVSRQRCCGPMRDHGFSNGRRLSVVPHTRLHLKPGHLNCGLVQRRVTG